MGWGYSHTWLDTSEEASDMTDDEELNWSFNIDQQDLLISVLFKSKFAPLSSGGGDGVGTTRAAASNMS